MEFVNIYTVCQRCNCRIPMEKVVFDPSELPECNKKHCVEAREAEALMRKQASVMQAKFQTLLAEAPKAPPRSHKVQAMPIKKEGA